VDAAAAADTSHYQHQDNRLRTAKRQLSGRLVFGTLDQPEGPYIPRTLTVGGITDRHGTAGAPVTQALSSLLEYPGGVLSGHVMHADGSPVTAGNVVYENGVTVGCSPAGSLGFALLPLTDGGRFEFRYVLQTCAGWRISAQDPVDGSVRDARGRVAATGEQIVRDLVLLGRGSVEGIVRAGATLEPVGGANVVALSLTDQQIGGSAKTNGDGYYRIDGITVGAVTVKAGDGQVVGTNTGRIERAGTVAKIDVTLNATGVRVSGYVKTEEGGVLKPVGQGIYVSYALQGTLVPRTFGVTQTDAAGRFLLEDMPEGEYILTAAINTRDRGEVTGFAGSVTSVEQDIVIHIPPPGELADVSGRILLPSSDPNVEILASGMEVVVDMDGRGVMTTNGTFHLTGLLIDPTRARSIRARTRDGKRTGNVSVYVDRPSVTDVKIRLSGLGKAVFTVLDPRGEKMQGVTVRVGGRCKDPCGCSPQVTDSAGEVTFHDVPIGGLAAKATWTSPGGGVDIAAGTATVLADGTTGFGILRFAGFGIVHGTVRYPEGQGEPEKGGPLHGATVSLTSLYYDSGLCVLTNGYSQSARTDTSGTFRFENVNVGRVSVAAQHFVLGRAGANGTLVKDKQELPLDLRMTDTMAERLTGVVYMPDGKTPAGAGVDVKATGGSIGELEVVTQPDGSYKFARVLGAGGYTITASDPRTGLVARQSIYLPKDPDPLVDEPVIHDLRLKGRGSVRVSVVNAAGARIENAFVKLTETEFPNRTFESTLDPSDDGVVTIDNVDEGRFAVVVSDSLARGGRASGVMPGEGAVVNVQVTFTVTNTVKGHFLLPAKGPTATPTPVPFGTVKLTSGGRVVGQMTTEGSGPNIGAFEFTFVPAGDFKLEAQDPMTGRTGFASGAVEKEGPPPPEHLAPAVVVDVYAMDLGIVRGKITHNGVDYTGPVHIDLVSGTYKVATVATGGTYEIPGVPEGKVVVTASLGDQGFLSGTASSTLKDEGEILPLDVALRGSGTVEGRVERVKLDGSRVAGPPSQVTIQVGGSGGGTLSTFTDDGQFRFEQVPAGLATLTADVLTGEDRGKATVEVPAQADPPVNIPITLNGTTSLELFAVDEDDNAIEGSVSIVGTGDFPFTRYREIRPEGITLTDLLAGPVNVRLTYRPENQPIRYGSISDTLVADVPKTITVKLQPGAFVAGRVFRSNGDPAGGAKVEIYAHLGGLITWVQAQDDGSFVANGIPLAQVGATRQITVKLIDELTDGRGLVENQTLGEPGITLEPVTLDDTPITLVAIEPPNGTVGVSVTQPLRLTFSDPVAGSGGSGILVKDGALGIFVHASLSSDKKVVTLTPGFGVWPDGRPLTIVATTFVTDIFGRRLGADAQSVFHTADVSPPKVVSVVPANLQREVPVGASMTATFNEPLKELLSAPGPDPVVRLEVYPNGPDVPGSAVLSAPAVVTFTPSIPLDSDTRYSLVVNGAVDLSGNPQTQASSTTFWTRDTIAPVLNLTQPTPDGWTKQPRPTISVGITEAGTGADTTADGSKLWLDCQAPSLDDCEPVNASRTASSLSFAPPIDLAEGLHTLAARVKDKAQPANVGTLAAAFGVDTVAPGPAGLAITGGTVKGGALVLRGSVGLAAAAEEATSGLSRIDVRPGTGTLVETLLPPSFTKTFNTSSLPEGPHVLYAVATDVAGNVGPAGAGVPVVVDNVAINVTIGQPASGARFRGMVDVVATASEPLVKMQFSIGSQTPVDGVLQSGNTYKATLSLASQPDGNATITVTAFGTASETDTKTATRTIVVDQTAPTPPDATRISAEPPQSGASLVFGRAGAVEPGAEIELTHVASGTLYTATAAANGSFSLSVVAAVDDALSLVAIDDVKNRSGASTVFVRQTPSLPPADGTTSLRFEGVLVDRIGPSRQLTPDGAADGVFTVSLAIGQGVTRQLSFIDLVGPSTRSTRPSFAVLGVSTDPGAPLLNAADGTVGFPVTSGATLTLFASAAGFIQPGSTYTVTAGFTDGSRFVGSVKIEAAEDHHEVAHSARITASPATVRVPVGGAGTTLLTLSDFRDIDGVRVPDDARIAVSVADMASKDPRGTALRSVGGAILNGVPAANNPAFKVFAIENGTVQVAYSSDPVQPVALTGAMALLQVLAADANANVLGAEAIATYDINLRALADRATVLPDPPSLYADKADRRSRLQVMVRDASGVPVPDGTRVLVSAANCAARLPSNLCIPSDGGTILGGDASPSGSHYRVLTVSNGMAECEYSAVDKTVAVGGLDTAVIQVLSATDTGAIASNTALGTGTIILAGPGSSDILVSPLSVPLVSPARPVQVRVRHVHHTRANLVPDGAKVVLSAANCAARLANNLCISSDGGAIVDGAASPTGTSYRYFTLASGEVDATYSSEGITAAPGDTRTGVIQALMGDPSGIILSSIGVGTAPVELAAPTNAVGTADPPAVLGDGALHTSTIRFDPVLDAWGNPLPDGTKVVASAASCAGRLPNAICISSEGGQILNGDASPTGAAYKVFNVEGGSVSILYGDQGITVLPAAFKEANVVLLAATSSGALAFSTALGRVPVSITSVTSVDATVSVPVVHADGSDRRSVVTVSNVRDSDGKPVPDGTRLGGSAANCATRAAGGVCIASDGGVLLGGTDSPLGPTHRQYLLQNGQVTFEYSSQGISVASGQKTAVVQLYSVAADGTAISNRAIGTASIQLVAPSAATAAIVPADLLADGAARLAQITISDLVDSGGLPIPDGALVGLTVVDCAARLPNSLCVSSEGGAVSSAGVSPGDGTVAPNNAAFRLFTVAGGQVHAVYSAQTLTAGVSATKVARVSVVPAGPAGTLSTTAFAVAQVNLRGTTSTTASGPATLARNTTTTVTFAGIKDSAGNTVPDGALVAVTVANCVLGSPCLASIGGTITDGSVSPSHPATFKVFAVEAGSITLTYQAPATTGTARLQVVPATATGANNGSTVLVGGVWPITVQ